jgi:DNA-binding transcriptional LysR family regulator
MYEALEFRHLRYFIAVAEHRTFSRAAERLHISQPALSAQIKQLEDALDVMLIIRGADGNSVIPAGRAFLSFAKQLLELRDRAIKETSLVHSGAHLPFRFGYSPFVNHDLVTEAVKSYRELAPEGRIEPSSASSGPFSAMVAARELDAAIVSLPLIEQELVVKIICVEKLVICLRADDPLAREELFQGTPCKNG